MTDGPDSDLVPMGHWDHLMELLRRCPPLPPDDDVEVATPV